MFIFVWQVDCFRARGFRVSEKEQDFENIVFIVGGGIGKNIMATTVVRNLKKQYPDKRIVVMCSFPDVFMHNPNVYRVFNFMNPLYFYEDFVLRSKSRVINLEPYYHYDYLYEKKHLAEVWCEMVGTGFDNIKPDIHLLPTEMDIARNFAAKIDKPIMLIQPFGGKNPVNKDPNEVNKAMREMFRRNISTKSVKETVTKMKDDYHILLAKFPNQPEIEGAQSLTIPLRQLFALIPHANKLLLIDSFMQHAAAAFEKKAVVCWGGTSPEALGYKSHNNLTKEVCDNPFCHRPNSFLFDRQPQGATWDCPYGVKCLDYSADEMLKALDK